MIKTYNISGMTCGNCEASVEKALQSIENVNHVSVNLENSKVTVTTSGNVTLKLLQNTLSDKYILTKEAETNSVSVKNSNPTQSKLKQLFPLFLIFGYITAAALLMNMGAWSPDDIMLDFMGLFYIVFSFFKFLDFRGFSPSFSMYDPLAKAIPAYGKIYPFLELVLGLMFLLRMEITIALVATIIILGTTTIGVTRVLLNKKSIQCACLGTALKLPMTTATFIENSIMLVMAVVILFNNL